MFARAPDSQARNAAETDKRTNGEQTRRSGATWVLFIKS
jgi:hypothetical protein